MMQEENTTPPEPVVSGTGEEKKEDSETQAEQVQAGSSTTDAEVSIADKTKEIMKDLAIDKPKQIFADFQGIASSFKEKVAFQKPADGESGEPAEKIDPMEKPRQFFSDIKEKATSFKGFSLTPGAATNATQNPDADLDVTSDASAPVVDGPTNDPLERSKEFFADMKEKASSFKIKIGEKKLDENGNPVPGPLDRMKADMEGFKVKMNVIGEKKFDEYGKPLPGPLDRMKADMEGFASGIREKMAATNNSRAAPTGSPDDNTAVFTISEEEEEGGGGEATTAPQPAKPTNELSMKFTDFMQSAKTTANDSLNNMPKLTFPVFNNTSDAPFSKFGDKFSAFRQSTIDPLSQKLGITQEESGTEEISFGAEPTIVDIPPPAAPATETTAVTDYV